MIRLVFCRRRNLGSLLLRTVLWSPWSHVALIDGDYVIEAAAPHGVQRRLLSDLIAASSKWEIVEFPIDDAGAAKILDAARSQLGKRYDWLGVLGIGFHRKWQSDNAWFCSELVSWAFASAGYALFRVKTWRITPRDLNIPNWALYKA